MECRSRGWSVRLRKISPAFRRAGSSRSYLSRHRSLALSETRASIPLDAIRRPRDTPIWKLEAALKCRSCEKGRYAPPVHMIKLTETREITPFDGIIGCCLAEQAFQGF